MQPRHRIARYVHTKATSTARRLQLQGAGLHWLSNTFPENVKCKRFGARKRSFRYAKVGQIHLDSNTVLTYPLEEEKTLAVACIAPMGALRVARVTGREAVSTPHGKPDNTDSQWEGS